MAAVAVDRAMEMFRARQRSTGQAGQVNPDVVQIEIHLECSNLANLDVMSKSDPVRSLFFSAVSLVLSVFSTLRAWVTRHALRFFFVSGQSPDLLTCYVHLLAFVWLRFFLLSLPLSTILPAQSACVAYHSLLCSML